MKDRIPFVADGGARQTAPPCLARPRPGCHRDAWHECVNTPQRQEIAS